MFGQVIIGPPGAGKSTYCHGMIQFLSAIGRKSCIINLDPANDHLPYPNCALDIRDYITLEEIMDELNLGPNGGLMYALESFGKFGLDEFTEKLQKIIDDHNYLLFDCPGQVELFTHNDTLMKIFKQLTKQKDLRLCVVSLVDSIYLTSPSQYISILLLSLRSMLQLNLPHINVISKIDKLREYGELPFRLEFYTDVQDLNHIIPLVESESSSALGSNYVRLTEAIAGLIEDFNLVSFSVLAVENKNCMIKLLSDIDKAVGYLGGSSEVGGDNFWAEASRQGSLPGNAEIDIHERWIERKDEYDRMEKEQEAALNGYGDIQNDSLTPEEEFEQAVKDWDAEHK